MNYDNLIGLDFDYGVQDCYTLVQRFYQQNYGIELPNYARPTQYWHHGMNLYMELYHENGFRPLDVHPSEWLPGDVILMAIRSTVCNHAGILVENGMMLHHFVNRRSAKEMYKGIWRNTTLAIVRHKDVVQSTDIPTIQLSDHLSPHTRRKINEQLQNNQITPEAL